MIKKPKFKYLRLNQPRWNQKVKFKVPKYLCHLKRIKNNNIYIYRERERVYIEREKERERGRERLIMKINMPNISFSHFYFKTLLIMTIYFFLYYR